VWMIGDAAVEVRDSSAEERAHLVMGDPEV
jgi:hypothetical protein